MILGGTKIYTVHMKPEDGLQGRQVFVREGFNMYAFVFTGLWCLYQRLWLPFLMVLLVNGSLGYLMKDHILLRPSYMAIQLGFNFLIGLTANDWVRARLNRKGYILADVSAADNLLHAQQRYLERALASPVV